MRQIWILQKIASQQSMGLKRAAKTVLIYGVFHITSTGGPHSDVGSPTKLTILTKFENTPWIYGLFHIKISSKLKSSERRKFMAKVVQRSKKVAQLKAAISETEGNIANGIGCDYEKSRLDKEHKRSYGDKA